MTDDHQRDAEIDKVIEAFARRTPPADHVTRVLAASGPSAGGQSLGRDAPLARQPGGRLGEPALPSSSGAFGRPKWPASTHDAGVSGWLRPRWVLPVAASVTVALGAWWQAAPAGPTWPSLDAATTPAPSWSSAREVERPVLPPQMYWAMDPFAEFATLRPHQGRLAIPATKTAAHIPSFGSAMPTATGASQVLAQAIDDEHLPTRGPATPTSLPEITLASILPIPVAMPPLPRPAAIELTEIAMAPITLAPIDTQTLPEEENP